MSTRHSLKTHGVYFDAIKRGDKTFDIRKNDKEYQAGDVLELVRTEGHPKFGLPAPMPAPAPPLSSSIIPRFPGDMGPIPAAPVPAPQAEVLICRVLYVLQGGSYGLEDGFCCMSIEPVGE